MGLVYRCDDASKLCMWSDATWAPNYGTFYDNYRSTTGWNSTAGRNLISWSSHRQSVVAQSSAESEWYADLGMPQHGAIPMMCDNQSTIKQTLNAVDQQSSRHLGMRSHFLRQLCHTNRLKMFFVPSRFQLADIMTKVLPRPCHEFLRSQLGMMSTGEFRSRLRTVPRLSS
jgi:hypothetical protein